MKQEKQEIEKCCRYCENAKILSDEDIVLCSKRGIMPATKFCRAFAYDPLKRDPKRRKNILPGAETLAEFMADVQTDNTEDGTDTRQEGNSTI